MAMASRKRFLMGRGMAITLFQSSFVVSLKHDAQQVVKPQAIQDSAMSEC
jgi:hypothetical protein